MFIVLHSFTLFYSVLHCFISFYIILLHTGLYIPAGEGSNCHCNCLRDYQNYFRNTVIQIFNYSIIQFFNYSIIQLFNYSIFQFFNFSFFSIFQFLNFSIFQFFNFSIFQLFNYYGINTYLPRNWNSLGRWPINNHKHYSRFATYKWKVPQNGGMAHIWSAARIIICRNTLPGPILKKLKILQIWSEKPESIVNWNPTLHNGALIWFDLIWFDLIWFDLIWFDLIWFDLIRLD